MAKRKQKEKTLGQRIRTTRAAAGLTQEELADAAGTTQDHVSDIERDVHVPGLALLGRLAAALGVGIGDLVE